MDEETERFKSPDQVAELEQNPNSLIPELCAPNLRPSKCDQELANGTGEEVMWATSPSHSEKGTHCPALFLASFPQAGMELGADEHTSRGNIPGVAEVTK